MLITLDLDDGMLAAVQGLARERRQTIGEVIADLIGPGLAGISRADLPRSQAGDDDEGMIGGEPFELALLPIDQALEDDLDVPPADQECRAGPARPG